ncbi:MAG: hypothetical protein U0871_08145 [Gemmataceae bacterium]
MFSSYPDFICVVRVISGPMRVVMMGTGTFAEPTFESLLAAGENVVGLVTQPERDTGRKGGSTGRPAVAWRPLPPRRACR